MLFRKIISVSLVFIMTLPSTLVFAQEKDKKDYYYEGQDEAKRDYSGEGATISGVASGILGGLLGWGIGSLIISGSSVEVPRRHISELDTKDRRDFEDGYQSMVKKTKKSKFNSGVGIGILINLVLILNASE